MQLDGADDLGVRWGAPLFTGRLEFGLVGLADQLGEYLVDTPTLTIEVGQNQRALGAPQIAAGRCQVAFGLVEKTPEAGDPSGLTLLQVVGFLGSRTTIEVGQDQTIELARCQDRAIGADNGSLLRQGIQVHHEDDLRVGPVPSPPARDGA